MILGKEHPQNAYNENTTTTTTTKPRVEGLGYEPPT